MIQGGSTGLRERVAAWRRISTLTARPPAATSTPAASSIAYMGVQGGCRCVVVGPLCCFPYRLPACTAIQMGRGAGKGSVPGPQGMVDGRAGYDAEPVICVWWKTPGWAYGSRYGQYGFPFNHPNTSILLEVGGVRAPGSVD